MRDRLARLISARTALFLAVTLFVGVMALIPLLFLLWDSFKEVSVGNIFDPSFSNFTLKNFRDAINDPAAFSMLGNSFFFAFGAMFVAFIFGGGIAFLVERTNTPFRNIAYGLMFVPLIMPSILKAVAWILLLSTRMGLLNKLWFLVSGAESPLFDAYTIPTMFWVEGLSMAPMTFLMMGAAFRAMDPSLEEAAYTAGANRNYVLFRVTLPLMTPAIAGIGLLQFVRGLEAFEVPLLMGLPKGVRVFSTNIYWVVRETNPPEYGLGFVYGITLIILAMVGLFIYQRMMGRAGQYATITGKGYRPRLMDLGKWRWFAGGFIWFFLFIAILLPFIVLLYASFLPFYMTPSARAWSSLTLRNFDAIFSSSQVLVAIKNTALLCGIVSIGGMLLGTIISWIVVRSRTKGSRVLDAIVFTPYAIPSVAMGFAFLIVFLIVPAPLNWIYGTIWALVLVYLVRFLPMGTRFTHAGMAQIKVELEEAAAASGAGFLTIVRRVILPLMIPSLVAGGLYIFLLSMKVMSMAAMLFTPDSFVLSIMIFQLWNEGSIPQVGALSVLMIFVGTVLTVISRRVAQRRAMVAEH